MERCFSEKISPVTGGVKDRVTKNKEYKKQEKDSKTKKE